MSTTFRSSEGAGEQAEKPLGLSCADSKNSLESESPRRRGNRSPRFTPAHEALVQHVVSWVVNYQSRETNAAAYETYLRLCTTIGIQSMSRQAFGRRCLQWRERLRSIPRSTASWSSRA